MCFTQEISGGFAVLMWSSALLWRTGPTPARVCMAYFAAMETLQAFQYSVINQCDNQMNQFLTLLGFLHLAFQPFFVNLFLGSYMNKAQKKYLPLILSLCVMGGVMLTNRFFKSWGDIACRDNIEPLCGPKLCTFRGDVHLAWQIPMQASDQDYFTPGFTLHFVLFYLPTFALGMYGFTLFLLISGPFLGRVMTNHQDEIPAIWCFFSIFQLFLPLFYAFTAKVAMFRKDKDAKAVATNGKKPVAVKEEEEADPVGGYGTMIFRGLILAGFLTAKRFAVMYLQTAQMPTRAAGAA
jgi:hypothetical protein